MTKSAHDRVRTELLLLFACIGIVTNAIGQVHGRVMMIDGKTPVPGVEVWVEYHLTHPLTWEPVSSRPMQMVNIG
jgi:hypothetical protein